MRGDQLGQCLATRATLGEENLPLFVLNKTGLSNEPSDPVILEEDRMLRFGRHSIKNSLAESALIGIR